MLRIAHFPVSMVPAQHRRERALRITSATCITMCMPSARIHQDLQPALCGHVPRVSGNVFAEPGHGVLDGPVWLRPV